MGTLRRATEPLLGAYTLQGLLLGVDAANECLIPTPGLLMSGNRLTSGIGAGDTA